MKYRSSGWREPVAAGVLVLALGCGQSVDPSTDGSSGTTGSSEPTGAADTGSSTEGATDSPTSGATDASTTDASTSDASTTDTSTTGASTTETGGSNGIDAACEALCVLWLGCEPDVYPDVETCATACVEQAPGLPECEPEAAAFNRCLSGLSCDEWALARQDMQFGRCTAAYETYGACL